MISLTVHDLDFILESLKYTRHKFENYEYPTYEYKQQRIDEVNEVIVKVGNLKKELISAK